MRTQFKKDLQTKTVDELKKLIGEAVKNVATLKLDHQQNKLKNTRDIFNKRKEVAMMKTFLQVKSSVAKAMDDKGEEVNKVVKETVVKAKKEVKKVADKGGNK